MQINLANTRLFRGMEPSDIEEMLDCLHAKEHAFQKGEIIFPEGTATEQIGVVLSGRVIIEMGDVWGNNSVLSSIGPGGVFAEAYACVPGEPLMVNVTAAEDTQALLLNIRRVLDFRRQRSQAEGSRLCTPVRRRCGLRREDRPGCLSGAAGRAGAYAPDH